MKVVPDDFIACMKASIDVVGWSVSLSSVKVFFLEMASVVALIFIEVPGMPLLTASFTSYSGSSIWLNAIRIRAPPSPSTFSYGGLGFDRFTISSTSACWFLVQIRSLCCPTISLLAPLGMRHWRPLFLSGLEFAI